MLRPVNNKCVGVKQRRDSQDVMRNHFALTAVTVGVTVRKCTDKVYRLTQLSFDLESNCTR